MTFSSKLHDAGLCFSRCYESLKSVVILCLTLTVCLGEEAKSENGCVGSYMFNKSMNKCIGEYAFLSSMCNNIL